MRIAPAARDVLTRARREQILDAAVRRWLEAGFDATTVDSIARAAGVAKGTVYLYFPTKRDILDAAIARHSMLPDLERVLSALDGRPAIEIVPLLVRAILHGLRARLSVVKLLVRELPVRPEHARVFVEQVVLPSNDALAAHLRSDPSLRGGIDLFLAARALIGMVVIFVFTQEVFGGNDVRPVADDEIVRAVSELFLHGVVRSTGRFA